MREAIVKAPKVLILLRFPAFLSFIIEQLKTFKNGMVSHS